jgi:MFS family permease
MTPSRPSELRQLLTETAFVRFWLARTLAMVGNQMLMVALGWHMYDLTGSAWDLGLVGLYQFLPALLFTLPAGHAADLWHRGRLFAACVAAQATVTLLLATLTHTDHIGRAWILGLSVVLGIARAFQMPAQQALIPLLVPRPILTRAIAVSASGIQAAIILGPALGGVLYLGGPVLVYSCCLALLLVSGTTALLVRYHKVVASRAANVRELLAGVAYVWEQKVLLGALSLDLFAVLLGGATALLPMFAKDILHTGPVGLGLLRGAPAVGALTMSLVLTRWPLQRQVGRRLLGAVGLFGVATVVFGVSESLWLSMLALACAGACDSISVVTRQTIMQVETPDELRGRVSAVNAMFIGASNQLGEFESGATAALLGPVGSVLLGGVGTVLVAWSWRYLFPELAQRDQMQTPAT